MSEVKEGDQLLSEQRDQQQRGREQDQQHPMDTNDPVQAQLPQPAPDIDVPYHPPPPLQDGCVPLPPPDYPPPPYPGTDLDTPYPIQAPPYPGCPAPAAAAQGGGQHPSYMAANQLPYPPQDKMGMFAGFGAPPPGTQQVFLIYTFKHFASYFFMKFNN